MLNSVVIAQPEGQARQLMLLYHGLGATPAHMAGLGNRLAMAYPRACVVSVQAPHPGDFGVGFQWFSTRDIDEALRTQRVAAVMPEFAGHILDWQSRTGTGPEETALIGFSQGAIMALECGRLHQGIAGRIISIAGRFARLPEESSEETTWYLLHGKQDAVVHYRHSISAAEHLVALGGDVVADILPFVGHSLDDDLINLLLERLSTQVPRRLWREALKEDGPIAPGQS